MQNIPPARLTRQSSRTNLCRPQPKNHPSHPVSRNHSTKTFGTNVTNCQVEKAPVSKKGCQKGYQMVKQQPVCNMQPQPNITLRNMDIQQERNYQLDNVKCYQSQIEGYLVHKDHAELAKNDFMLAQISINEQMRAVLIGWIIDVHHKFKLQKQTLYLTVFIIDSYLESQQISKNYLQLVGIASLFIGCKYQEIYSPTLKKLVEVCDNAYSGEEVLQMESQIMLTLNFDLSHTPSLHFIQCFSKRLNLNQQSTKCSEFLVELSLIEYKMCKYKASIIAHSAMYLAAKITNTNILSSALLISTYNIDEMLFKACLKDLLEIYRLKENQKFSSVTRKYLQTQ